MPKLIRFHAGQGSSSEASGAGPDDSLFGFFGQSTTANNWINLPEAGPQGGLGNVEPEDMIWMTPAGVLREFAEIVEVDVPGNRVRTVENMGVRTQPWAIGGYRASLASDIDRIITDSSSGWGVELLTAQTITSPIVTPSHHFKIWGRNDDDPQKPPELIQLSDVANIRFSNYSSLNPRPDPTVRGLVLANLAGTKNDAHGIEYTASSYLIVENVVFGDQTATLRRGGQRTSASNPIMHFRNCTFQYTTDWGCVPNGANGCIFEGCLFVENNGQGALAHAGQGDAILTRCVFARNANYGFRSTNHTKRAQIQQCVFHENGDAVWLELDSGACANSIFTDNTRGITHSSGSNRGFHLSGCAFRGNGSDATGSIYYGDNIVYPGDDVYVDPARDNFILNTNNPGGAELRTTGMTYSVLGRSAI